MIYLEEIQLVQYGKAHLRIEKSLELIVKLYSEGFILYVNSLYWNIGRELSRRKSGLGILGNGLSKGPQE